MTDRPLTVLLFDDDVVVVQTIVRHLRRDGHDVHCAGDVAEAIDIASRHELDIAILDLNPNFTSGIEVVGKLDAATQSHLPKVIITSSKNKLFRDEAIAAGVEGFVEKPFTHGFLRMKMLEALALTT